MTPTHFYNGGEHGERFGDESWLVEQLNQLPDTIRGPVSQRYGEIYQELSLSDPNKCRFRCNAWMRKTVEKNKNKDIIPF